MVTYTHLVEHFIYNSELENLPDSDKKITITVITFHVTLKWKQGQ